MKHKNLIGAIALVIALATAIIVTLSPLGIARVNKGTKLKARLRKPDIVDLVFVGYNNWSYVMRNQGSYFYDSPDADGNGNNSGGEFPRGSANTIVFAAGLYIATEKGTDKVTSETEFSTEFQPGRIDNSGVPFAELTAEDPASATQQVYLIDRTLSGDDYSQWPTDAPRDVFNFPALIADAQTWVVFNDLDVTLSQEGTSVSPRPGLGMEVVLESFAFSAGALSDVVYLKFTIENKTNEDYPNSYLGLWMDPDVVSASNDIVGVDTARGLGFCYNADNSEPGYVTGFDFFQGPVVDTSAISETLRNKFRTNNSVLVYDPNENRYLPTALPDSQIWLGATSFNTYANGTDPRNNEERYNLLAGLFADGNPKFGSGVDDYYAFRGDPLGPASPDVATSAEANDQRILHGVGPFTIKAGSQQEIWAGVVGAAQDLSAPNDRLAPITAMRNTDDLAQTTFEAGLIAPAPPDVPITKVRSFDGKVAITWENNSEFTYDIAGDILGIKIDSGYTDDYVGNDFQGYRVWKSRTGLPGSYTMLAQYDKIDGITTIVNRRLSTSATLIIEEINVGSNSGLRYAYIDEDVVNGQAYYYSVTAFDAQPYIADGDVLYVHPDFGAIPTPSGLPITLETAQTANVKAAVPMKAPADYLTPAVSVVTHSAGVSEGVVEVEAVDTDALTGNNYRVEFIIIDSADVDSAGVTVKREIIGIPAGTLAYRVRNVTTNTLVSTTSLISDDAATFIDVNTNGTYEAATDLPYDDRTFSTIIATLNGPGNDQEFYVWDGMWVKVFNPPLAFKSATRTGGADYEGLVDSAGTELTGAFFTPTNFGLSGLSGGGELGFFGGVADPGRLWDTEIRFSRDSTQWSRGYIHTGFTGANDRVGLAPFAVYEVDPLDGDTVPRRLNVMIRDQVGLNGWYLNNGFGGDATGFGPAIRNYLYPVDDNYDSGAGSLLGESVFHPGVMYSVALSVRDIDLGSADTPTDFNPPTGDGLSWNENYVEPAFNNDAMIDTIEQKWIYYNLPDESVISLKAFHVIQLADQYSWNTTALTATTDRSQAKKNLDNIRVVPNPYSGRSAYQTSLFDKQIKFTNLPATCTIRIFTVAGDLIATLSHNDRSNNDRVSDNPLSQTASAAAHETSVETWDLRNPGGKFVASGIYIAIIDAPGVGRKSVKFGVLQESITINGPDVR